MGGVVVRPRSRILHGHDWVYASEVLKVFGSPADGDVVSIKDGKDRMLGSGVFNSRSQIVVRRFSRRRQDLDGDFFRRRIGQAIEHRRKAGCRMDLCRLVWSESDGLPGVVADRYGSVVVLQTLTAAMDLRRESIAAALLEETGAATIHERNDAPSRKAEGLGIRSGHLAGTPAEPIEIDVDGVVLRIDPATGQKTGLYLDQLESHRMVASMASGRSVLDCFSNQGGFALACAKAGASPVTAVESGAASAERLRGNASANALAITVREADVFDFLKRPDHPSYDLIILDPPSFTRGRGRVGDALRGYRDLHAKAAPLLSKDGLLATFCCSHHVSAKDFEESVAAGLHDAHRSARLVRRIQQPPDHPVILGIPETEYLKGLVLEALPGR